MRIVKKGDNMRVLTSKEILAELARIKERPESVEMSNSRNILSYLQDFYNHLNGALGAFEELELSIELEEVLTENDLQVFIKSLSVDVGKIEKALKNKLQQKHKQQFKVTVIKIKGTYKYFMMEYKAVESEVDKKIKQYIWLMQQAVLSLNEHIKEYNKNFKENLQQVFEDLEC